MSDTMARLISYLSWAFGFVAYFLWSQPDGSIWWLVVVLPWLWLCGFMAANFFFPIGRCDDV